MNLVKSNFQRLLEIISETILYQILAKDEIRRVVKMGFDCVSPEEFAQGLMLQGGIRNTLVMFGEINKIEPPPQRSKNQVKDVTKLLDFDFLPDGFHVRKNSTIGPGKKIVLEEVEPDATYDFSIVLPEKTFVKFDKNINADLCVPQNRELINQKPNGLNPEPKIDHHEPEGNSIEAKRLWYCENALCTRRFIRKSDLEFHLANGQCSIPLKTQTTGTYLIKFLHALGYLPSYFYLISGDQFLELQFNRFSIASEKSGFHGRNSRYLATHLERLNESEIPSGFGYIEPDVLESREYGFANEQKRSNVRHDPDINAFLEEIFWRGERSGKSTSAEKAYEEMRKAKLDDGVTQRFHHTKWIEVPQIKSVFSRLKIKQERGEIEPPQCDIEEAIADLDQKEDDSNNQTLIAELIAKQAKDDMGGNRNEHPFLVSFFFLQIP